MERLSSEELDIDWLRNIVTRLKNIKPGYEEQIKKEAIKDGNILINNYLDTGVIVLELPEPHFFPNPLTFIYLCGIFY